MNAPTETMLAQGAAGRAVPTRGTNETIDVAALLAKLGARPRRITSDSRRVEAGVAFAAYPGTRADGRAFVPDAIRRGACAVLWEPQGFAWNPLWQAPNFGVEHLQSRLGAIADFIYGSPSQRLWMTGVTGTNGKTSCAHWIAQALDACGRRAAVVGTLGNGFVGGIAASTHTTPDAAVLHELLAQFHAAGAQAVAMEVSSHGLEQGRVNAVQFDVALFTNLTRDHLDYHQTMAAYAAAKARLFAWPGLRTAVVNADDAFGQRLIDDARARGQHVLTYGLGAADVAAGSIRMQGDGMELDVVTPWGKALLAAPVVGAFNAQNLLGVLGVLLASDVPLATAVASLARISPPAGRMQRFGGGGKPVVVVDYAHTPDALEQVLHALRPAVAVQRELVCVFGCGGDRDPGKRPAMGAIAARLADRIVVTTDNPRGEDPAAIASAVVKGIREVGNRCWSIEHDRRAAIHRAIAAAGPGDLVLLAGKGHETYQERDGVRSAFSDASEAASALAAWSDG
jgi:UDP-N-acetylmuramyl-tripeptide synthetase